MRECVREGGRLGDAWVRALCVTQDSVLRWRVCCLVAVFAVSLPCLLSRCCVSL